MKLTKRQLKRIIEEETALALRFLRFEQQIDALEDLIATKITQRKLKQIIKEETAKALKEGYYGAPRLISPDIEGAFEQAKAACKQGVLATMEGNELSFSCATKQ